MNLKQKQDKARRDQKLYAAGLATLALILTEAIAPEWILVSLIYAGIVVVMILYELADEAHTRAIMQEFYNSVPEVPEPVTIDVIA